MSKYPYNLNRKTIISKSGLTIYDPIEPGDPKLWIPTLELEVLLTAELVGISLGGLPLRTRSKVLKSAVCTALGYPVPNTFTRTKPRFPGQNFDTYVQKSNNLQIWNEEIAPLRRYVLIRITDYGVIAQVKVVQGNVLAILDRTGTLTRKYQAHLTTLPETVELVTTKDTDNLEIVISKMLNKHDFDVSPVSYPDAGSLLPIKDIYNKLVPLVGVTFTDAGYDQERNRGAELHKLVCFALGYNSYQDIGQFPDILHQLLEVKLQTSLTIDLGLIRPNSQELLGIPRINRVQIRHCDVRYAIFYGHTTGEQVTITHFYLSTGESFFARFPQFQGKTVNAKIQIPLPRGFFG